MHVASIVFYVNYNTVHFPRIALRAHGVVVSHPLRMRKALGSNPSVSIWNAQYEVVGTDFIAVACLRGACMEFVHMQNCARVPRHVD